MGGPVFYSTNPWFATEVANKYRGGVHFAWVCECFDSSKAAAGSAAALIAPSSNPKRIYDTLYEDCKNEDRIVRSLKDTNGNSGCLGERGLGINRFRMSSARTSLRRLTRPHGKFGGLSSM